ncbi:hypothetical protein HRbin10_00493 [bacterium HR10]|nr:hypothetical protein HRbin10_00493 [bacterium HR10]
MLVEERTPTQAGMERSSPASGSQRSVGTKRSIGAQFLVCLTLGWLLIQLSWAQESQAQKQNAEPASQEQGSSFWKGIRWNGYVAISYTHNTTGSTSTFRVFDEEARQFTLHQMGFWLEKPSTGESPLGFGVDVVLGSDAKKIHAMGLGDVDDPFDLTQAYITYRVPIGAGLMLKAGKFVTLHGAEVIRRPENFNISRSILFGYAIPFTHAGFLATYPITDRFTVTVGLVNGWDNVTDNNSGKSLHGMVTLLPRKDLTVTIGGTWGPERAGTNGPKRGLVDVVAAYKPTPTVSLIANFDYGREADAVPDRLGGVQKAHWYGGAGYVLYDLTTRWAIGLRGEFFNDPQGFRLGWTDAHTGLPTGLTLREVTGTARYKITEQLLVNFEYRQDFANHPVFGQSPGRQKSQGTILVELVYVWK